MSGGKHPSGSFSLCQVSVVLLRFPSLERSASVLLRALPGGAVPPAAPLRLGSSLGSRLRPHLPMHHRLRPSAAIRALVVAWATMASSTRPRHGLRPTAVGSSTGALPSPGLGSGPPVDQGSRCGASEACLRPRSPATALGLVPTGGRESHLDQPAGTSERALRLPTSPLARPVSRATFLVNPALVLGDRRRYPCRPAVPATAAPGAGSPGPSFREARRPRGQ